MSLAKETIHAIESFSKRRRDLILVRGVCAFAGSVIVIMSALALLDRMIIMPDRLRWTLSVLGYAAIGFVLWYVCLRHLFGKEDPRQTARLIEKARPDLHEDLISAVELGEGDADAERFDSAVFRHLVQRDVAGRVSETKAEDLLPATLISRWVKGAGAAVLVFVALLFFPHFPQLFSRALLPGANLARPSNIKIFFVAPDPADRIVPSGDTQALEVRIEGGDIERVFLETTEDGRTEKVRLARAAGNRFTGGIKVGSNDVRYRVRARGAVSRYHLLESRPRPAVSEFAKTYRPPAYSGLSDETVIHDHGDISGLEGSQVELVLAVNQEITEAELQLKADRKDIEPVSIPLATNADGNLVASLALDGRHTSYKVHLVAAESGFENTFSPFFEIRAVPDLTPKVELAEPENNRDVRSNEALAVRGSAEDDVALAEVLHAYRINANSWTEVSLVKAPGRYWEFSLDWQLRLLPLKPGDILVTKLIAIDTKGNRGESTPVRLAVAAEEDNSAEREWAEREKRLAGDLAELKDDVERAERETAGAAQVLREDPGDRDLQDRQQLVRAERAAQDAAAKAEQLWEQLEAALADAPDRAEAEQLEAVAAAVAELKDQALQRLEEAMEDAAAGRDVPAEGQNRPEQLAGEAAQSARRAAEAMRALAAEDMAEVVAEDLGNLADNQEDIADAARELPPGERETLTERQDLARHQAEAMEEELRDLSEQLDGGERNTARNAAEQIGRERAQLDESLATPDATQRLPDAAERMAQSLENAARDAARVAETAERRAEQAMQQLADATASPSEEVEQLRQEAERLAALREQLDNQQDESRAAELAEGLQQASEDFSERAEAVADQLQDLSRAEEASAASNPQEANDLAQAARALDDLADAATEVENGAQAAELAEALSDLRDAIETAEAAARAADIAAALEDLAEGEQALAEQQAAEAQPNRQQPSLSDPAANPEQNTDLAEQVAADLGRLPEEIARGLEDPQEAQRAAQQAANSGEANELSREMEERQRADLRGEDDRAPLEQSENIAALQEDIAAIQEALEPQAAQAREQLAAMAPEAREMLRELAEELDQAAAAAEQLAQQAAEAQPPAQSAEDVASNEAGQAGEQETPPSDPQQAAAPDAASDSAPGAAEPAAPGAAEPAAPTPAELAAAAAEMLAAAEDASESLEDAIEALGDQASAQDLGSEQGREAARDADDAIAQLNEQAAPEAAAAAESLAEAAATQQPQEQSQALQQAAESQRGLADQLQELADQLDAIAEGDAAAAEAARTAMRASEAETGAQEPLGEAYGQAEDLAELRTEAADDPAAALAALEQELADNQAMQAALGELAAETAMKAAETLAEAAAKESELGESLAESGGPQAGAPQAPAAQQQQGINAAAEQAASDLARAAKQQERIGESAAAEALAEAGKSTESFADDQGEGGEALDQLSSNPSPSANQPALQSAGEALAEKALAAAQAAQQAAQAAAAQSAANAPASPAAAESAASLAQALDALDQMMAQGTPSPAGQPSPSQGNPSGQPGQEASQGAPPPSPAASALAQAAQAALAEAQAQQAAAMAQARAQGQTPGSPSPSQGQSMAQNGSPSPGQPSQGQPGSSATGGGNTAPPQGYALNNGALPTDNDAWGKLPPKVAQDIIEARRQGVAPDYRSAVESYYKAIADRARQSN